MSWGAVGGAVAGAAATSLFGGGGGSNTTTESTDPWVGVQPYLRRGYQRAEDLVTSPFQAFPSDQAVAGFTPETQQGFDMLSGLAGQLPGQTQQTIGAWQNVLSPEMLQGITPDLSGQFVQGPSALQADINPYLNAAAMGATQPIVEQLTQQILPQISQQALATGGFSGSRRGLAEGQAVTGATRAMGDITSDIYRQGYENLYGRQLSADMQMRELGQQAQLANLQAQLGAEQIGAQTRGQGLGAYLSALSRAPEMLGLQTLPAELMLQIGGARQQQTQAELDAQRRAFEEERDVPFTRMMEYLRAIQGAPGGTTTTNEPAPYTSPIQGALAGASIGQSIAASRQQNTPQNNAPQYDFQGRPITYN